MMSMVRCFAGTQQHIGRRFAAAMRTCGIFLTSCAHPSHKCRHQAVHCGWAAVEGIADAMQRASVSRNSAVLRAG